MKITEPDQQAVKDAAPDDLPPFFYLSDLVGRHALFLPKSIETVEDTFNPGKTKERIIADVLVIDGRKTTVKDERNVFPKLPRFQQGVWVSGSQVVPALKRSLPDSGRPEAGVPVLAYVNKPDKAYVLQDADEDVHKAVAEGQYDEFLEDSTGQSQEPPF